MAEANPTPDVLIIEDTLSMAIMYQQHLKKAGYRSTICQSGASALLELRKGKVTTVLLDLQLPDMNGLDIIEEMDGTSHNITFIVITANGSVNTAVDAMRAGAFDFLIKPFPTEKLLTTVRNALEREAFNSPKGKLKKRLDKNPISGFVGNSDVMQTVYKMIENVADSNAAVFITGESGTGKEVTAQAIHKVSQRRDAPFVAINCAALPENLIESEIFGHVKGAFTGATRDRKGAAMRANGGTLFLDEICEMDLSLQSKLLRFLQERTIQRVGDDVIHASDVRIVCATNRDPMAEVRAGRFREDLFYRLHVVPLILPPLRDRGDDVMLISEHFLQQFAEEDGKTFAGFDEEARQTLMAYGWPGNVRQLQNVIRNIVVMNAGGLVSRDMLPVELSTLGQTAGPSAAHLNNPMAQADIYASAEPQIWPSHIAPTGLPPAGLPPGDLLGRDLLDSDLPVHMPPQPAPAAYDQATTVPTDNHFGTGNPVADQLIGNAYPAQAANNRPIGHHAPQAPLPIETPFASPSVIKTREDIKALDNVIRETIEEAILICDGSVPKAARALDVSPSTLYRRLQSWATADAKLRERNGHQAA